MNSLREIEAAFREVFPNSKTVAREYILKGKTKSSTETYFQGENILADKTIIEGVISAVSDKKHSIQVNESWYKFNNEAWDEHGAGKDINGKACRFETSSTTREYEGKNYETNWVNGFTLLSDIDDKALDVPMSDEDFEFPPDDNPVSDPEPNTKENVSGKIIKALGLNKTDVSILSQVAFKEVYSKENATKLVVLAEDIENAVNAMLLAQYKLMK